MAIAMASVGGAGFLHYNMSQEDQIANVKAVKAHRLGYVTRPEVMGPAANLAALDQLATRRGFTSAGTSLIGSFVLSLVHSFGPIVHSSFYPIVIISRRRRLKSRLFFQRRLSQPMRAHSQHVCVPPVSLKVKPRGYGPLSGGMKMKRF